MEIKERTVESLMSSNVALRAEVVAAKSETEQANEKATANEEAKKKALVSEQMAVLQLEEKTEEIKSLKVTIDGHDAIVKAAKADAEKANLKRQDAERKKDEACMAETEM